MTYAIGVWCGSASKALLQPVMEGMPLLRLTMRRVHFQRYALIPWTADLDHLEKEVKSWPGQHARRCHPDERLAMRDLVTELRVDCGLIVHGTCGLIDHQEISLAIAYMEAGFEKYESATLRAYPKATWLGFRDTDEWSVPMDIDSIRRLHAAEEREKLPLRGIRAREAP